MLSANPRELTSEMSYFAWATLGVQLGHPGIDQPCDSSLDIGRHPPGYHHTHKPCRGTDHFLLRWPYEWIHSKELLHLPIQARGRLGFLLRLKLKVVLNSRGHSH